MCIYIYICAHVSDLNGLQLRTQETPWMDRPVAIGGFSGVASTLVLSLLRNWVQDHTLEVQVPQVQLPPFECPEISFEDIPCWTFGAGVVVGVLLGPLIDFIWLLRQRWRRFIWRLSAQESSGGGRPLFKVVA